MIFLTGLDPGYFGIFDRRSGSGAFWYFESIWICFLVFSNFSFFGQMRVSRSDPAPGILAGSGCYVRIQVLCPDQCVFDRIWVSMSVTVFLTGSR